MVSPFIASAALSIAGYSCNNVDIIPKSIENFSEKEERLLLAILVSFIFGTSDLCINPYSKKLIKNFDKRSDILTLLQTFLELAQCQTKEIQQNANEYGLNAQNTIRIKNQIQQICDNLFKIKSNYQNINETNDDDDENEPFNWSLLFSSISNFVKYYMRENKLFDFIQSFIDKIGENKPEWLQARNVTFVNIENAAFEPSFIYNSNNQSRIILHMRPGSVGLDCPGNGFILCITEVKSLKMNFGSIIHTNIRSENSCFIPHPISIEISNILNNDFSSTMVKAYLENNSSHFKKMYMHQTSTESKEKTTLIFKSHDFCDKVINLLSFIPIDELGIQIFNEALRNIELLMPYTPSTILIKKPDLNCLISIGGISTHNINSKVHCIQDNDYFAYKINENTIKFLIQNINILKSNMDIYSIAITGEYFSFLLDNSNSLDMINSCSIKAPMPKIKLDSNYVFSDNPKYFSHLIMTSSQQIDQLSGLQIPWFANNTSVQSSNLNINTIDILDMEPNNYYIQQVMNNFDETYFINIANQIIDDIIRVNHCSSLLIFSPPNAKFIIKGEKPPKSDSYPQFVNGNISQMFYDFALNKICGSILKNSIDLKGFYYLDKSNTPLRLNINIENIFKFNLGNGCFSCICRQTSESQIIIDQIVNYFANQGIQVISENVPEYEVNISHCRNMSVGKTEFIKRVTMVAHKFGSIISKL